MAALAAAQDLKHQPLNHFHQSLHNHFSTLSSLHNSESVFHYKCVCVKIFLLLCEIVGEKQSEQIFVSKTNYSMCA